MDGLTHFLAVGTSTGVVRVYDTISNKEVVTPPCALRKPTRALCWNESLQWLTAGYATGKIASLDWRSRSRNRDDAVRDQLVVIARPFAI